MENAFLYLSSCSTCVRIIKDLGINGSGFLQDVKIQIVTHDQLAFLYKKTNSYELLINKRGRVYAELKRTRAYLKEEDYKRLLEKEYSCLKRPILIYENKAYVGNAKTTIAQMNAALNE